MLVRDNKIIIRLKHERALLQINKLKMYVKTRFKEAKDDCLITAGQQDSKFIESGSYLKKKFSLLFTR